MRPIHFTESNIVFDKPTTMDDSECLPISAYIGKDDKGMPFINTVWHPSKDDIDAILAGQPIIVCVLGTALPPMSLFTCDHEGKPNF